MHEPDGVVDEPEPEIIPEPEPEMESEVTNPNVLCRESTEGYRLIEQETAHFKRAFSFEIPIEWDIFSDRIFMDVFANDEISATMKTDIGWGSIWSGTREDILNNTNEFRETASMYDGRIMNWREPYIFETQEYEIFRYICGLGEIIIYYVYANGEFFNFPCYVSAEHTPEHIAILDRIAESVRF
jgi:hypothetical protein